MIVLLLVVVVVVMFASTPDALPEGSANGTVTRVRVVVGFRRRASESSATVTTSAASHRARNATGNPSVGMGSAVGSQRTE
jgi:hypothetical protein